MKQQQQQHRQHSWHTQQLYQGDREAAVDAAAAAAVFISCCVSLVAGICQLVGPPALQGWHTSVA